MHERSLSVRCIKLLLKRLSAHSPIVIGCPDTHKFRLSKPLHVFSTSSHRRHEVKVSFETCTASLLDIFQYLWRHKLRLSIDCVGFFFFFFFCSPYSFLVFICVLQEPMNKMRFYNRYFLKNIIRLSIKMLL